MVSSCVPAFLSLRSVNFRIVPSRVHSTRPRLDRSRLRYSSMSDSVKMSTTTGFIFSPFVFRRHLPDRYRLFARRTCSLTP